MMSLTRYKRALNKLLPVGGEKGHTIRFRAARKTGFKPYNVMNMCDGHTNEIKNNMFKVAYLEFVRYNADKIAFQML